MTGLANIRERLFELVVIGALTLVVGYLIGNSDAMETKAEVVGLRKDKERLEGDVAALAARVAVIEPRVERLTTLSEFEREKGKRQ